jgi:hypothetical protein
MGGKPQNQSGRSSITKRGGYEPGPKTMSELKPPPNTPGAGSKPKETSSK